MMDPVASAVDKLKSFAKSGEKFLSGLIHHRESSSHRNPIEILKRLQREAFSDLMKLRDRQEKVERMLTFYSISKGDPFGGTRVRGEVDVLGPLLVMANVEQQDMDAIIKGGIRTGIDSRIVFESTARERDDLEAEFVASLNAMGNVGDLAGGQLSLSKVRYTANMSDWFSVVAIPVGAQCKDLAVLEKSSSQERGLSEYVFFGPPLLHQHNGSAIGLTVRRENIVASLAQFVAELGVSPASFGRGQCFSSFAQVVCELPRSSKISLFGLHQVPKLSQQASLGALTIPLGIPKCCRPPETSTGLSASPLVTNREDSLLMVSTRSLAIMLEKELDESTKVKGWLQMRDSDPRFVQWAITMSHTPKDDIGWGLSLGGRSWDHLQVEASLKLNLGKRFSLQPGLVYLTEENKQMPALMFRSTWSL